MIKTDSHILNAKLSALIPAMATAQASIVTPTAALPTNMKPSVQPENWIPQAFMNYYYALDVAQSQARL